MTHEFLHLLSTTQSEEAVVALAVRYLESWQPAELAAIPAHCRPRAPRDVEELSDTAFALTKARIEDMGSNPRLDAMETFFAHACARVSQLEAAPYRIAAGKSYLTR
jgi:hypothetical protein